MDYPGWYSVRENGKGFSLFYRPTRRFEAGIPLFLLAASGAVSVSAAGWTSLWPGILAAGPLGVFLAVMALLVDEWSVSEAGIVRRTGVWPFVRKRGFPADSSNIALETDAGGHLKFRLEVVSGVAVHASFKENREKGILERIAGKPVDFLGRES